MLPIQTCNILGVNVAVTDTAKTIDLINQNLQVIRGHYICVSNVHTTVMSYENKNYLNIQNNAIMVLPDGKPLSVVERLRGYRNARKVSGPDLLPAILKLSEMRGYTHYFYGSRSETLQSLQANLKKKYPDLKIVGMMSPPFRQLSEKEETDIVKTINEAHPDFLWVGLGAPKQEIWMAEHENIIDSLMIGVGAAFDFHAGSVQRAPFWMQKCGLEWFYRLLQDPKRLWKRYLTTNVKFLWYILIQRRN